MNEIKRYCIEAYCHRCGSAEGSNAVVVSNYKDKFGEWVKYEDIKELEEDCLITKNILEKFVELCDKTQMFDKVGSTYIQALKILKKGIFEETKFE